MKEVTFQSTIDLHLKIENNKFLKADQNNWKVGSSKVEQITPMLGYLREKEKENHSTSNQIIFHYAVSRL